MNNNDDLCEQPIAWQVSAVDGRRDFVDSFKKKLHRERCATKALADARKMDLQAAGMVASVTPVFAPKGGAESQSANAPDYPVRRLFCRLEDVPMNATRARARQLRARMRQLLDDADSGAVCLTQNADDFAELVEELREVEDEIDDCLIAQAAEQ